jgi:hypothetical protein
MTRFLSKLFGKTKTARNTARPPARARLGVESLDRRDMPSVTMSYGGGPVIPNVQVEAVYLGSTWASYNPYDWNSITRQSERGQMDRFLGDIVQSSYMNGLSQYYGYVPGYYRAFPGKGTFVKDDVVPVDLSSFGTTPTNSVPESYVESILFQEVLAHRLDPSDANKLYVVIMPPGVAEQGDFDNKGSPDGGGHHAAASTWWSPAVGSTMHFAVIEHGLTSGFGAEGLNVPVTAVQKMTFVTSHELAEAVTDPEGDGWQATQYVAPGIAVSHPGWYEIGDVTQDLATGNSALAYEDGYLVQKYWSYTNNTSIAPGATDY